MAYRDSFGVPLEAGDYVVSGATSTGNLKVGTVYFTESGTPMMNVAESNHNATGRSALGYMSMVLRKADGTVPDHVKGA
jgi:hypothetical protein